MAREGSRTQSPQGIEVLVAIAIVFFVAVALYWAQAIFIPLATAILVSFVLTPVVTYLQKRGLGRVPSVIIVITASLLVMAVVGLVVGHQMIQLTRTLPDHADVIKGKLANVKEWFSDDSSNRLTQLVNDVSNIIDPAPENNGAVLGQNPPVVVKSSPDWVTRIQVFLSPAAEMLGQAALTFILVFFMLLRREDLRNRAIRLLARGRVITTTKAADEISQRISRFLLAQFMLNAAFGLAITVGLLLMGIRYAPLWGFTAFLMRYVPYIGTWIGVLPPALFTFAVTEGWGWTIGVVLLFLGLELICNNLIEPLLYGRRLGLSEVAQLVATAFWLLLWGPIGMILAWPLTTCVLMFGKYVPQWQFLSVLLGDEPVLSPRVAFYQRLAARDADEATDIIEKELTTRPVDAVFDDIVAPALVEARRDKEEAKLSDEDLGFVVGCVREIAENVSTFKNDNHLAGPSDDRVRLLIAAGSDSLDHAAADLFAQMLDPGLWEVEVAPASTLPSELLDRIEEFEPAVLVIALLPPGGITHARYLCKRIRQRFENVKVAIGRWADSENSTKVTEQLIKAGADEVTTTMTATVSFLSGWRTVFASSPAAAQVKAAEPAERHEEIGTVPASTL